MQGAVQIVQADPSRLGGPSECLAVAMMAKKADLRVIPHVGDMGQISQHMLIAYHVVLDLPLIFLEYIPHVRIAAPVAAHVAALDAPRVARADASPFL